MSHVIDVKSGCFSYNTGHEVLKNITFSLDKGKVMAIMGPNGIGKTTLIKCIVGLLKWNSGSSYINGEKSEAAKAMREIGYVPQAHRVSFPYSVCDMVVFGKIGHNSFFATPGRQDYKLAEKVLKKVGIYDLKDQPCNELSGGQLQLVYIARALINAPKLLVLDEPESHLDFRNQLRLLKLIKKVVSEHQIACIINTHYPNHALRIADQCFLMGEQGYVVGTAEEVMTDYNIRAYFGVHSHAIQFSYNNEIVTSYSFLDEA